MTIYTVYFTPSILIIFTLYRGPLIGAYHRAFNTPDILKDRTFVLVNDSNFPDALKRSFYYSYKNSADFAGLKQKRQSIEGTPIFLYLITESGNLTLVLDYTHDCFSSRRFFVENKLDLFIGTIDQDGNLTRVYSLYVSGLEVRLGGETNIDAVFQAADVDALLEQVRDDLGLDETTTMSLISQSPVIWVDRSSRSRVGIPCILARVDIGPTRALGLLIDAMLHANNFRDVEADRRTGALTLAQLTGEGGAKLVFYLLLLAPYLFVVSFGAAVSPWALLPILTLPAALQLLVQVWVAAGDLRQALAVVPQKTAQLNLLFGALLAAGLFTSRSL